MCAKLGRAKFQRFTARGTFTNRELNKREWGKKIQWKAGHISETVKDRAKVTINH